MMRYLAFPFIAILIGTPAFAELWAVHTEANNIQCTVGDDPEKTDLACILQDPSGAPALPKPDDCDGVWGQGFFIADRGPVTMFCMDDPSRDSWGGNFKFDSKEPWDFGGVTCTATRATLSCENSDGHGFSLSQTSQSVY